MTEAAHGIFPMVLGVTGHRDLRVEDERILEQRVLDLIRMIKRTYPHTPLVLLSPLAEGADRLVAEVALAEGVQLVAPLPMPAEEYESDFEDEISREAFRNLLRRAAYSFSLPLRSSLTMIREGGQARSLQYEQVGAYIARHSQILIALWDGISLNLTGGTSRIIEFQLRGVPEPYASPRSPLDQLETGLVYHILTPRRTNPCPAGVPFSIRLLLPEGNESDEPEPITPGRNATGTHAGNDVLEFPARATRMRGSSGPPLPPGKRPEVATFLQRARSAGGRPSSSEMSGLSWSLTSLQAASPGQLIVLSGSWLPRRWWRSRALMSSMC